MATEEEDEAATVQEEEGSLFDSPEILSFRRQVSPINYQVLFYVTHNQYIGT